MGQTTDNRQGDNRQGDDCCYVVTLHQTTISTISGGTTETNEDEGEGLEEEEVRDGKDQYALYILAALRNEAPPTSTYRVHTLYSYVGIAGGLLSGFIADINYV